MQFFITSLLAFSAATLVAAAPNPEPEAAAAAAAWDAAMESIPLEKRADAMCTVFDGYGFSGDVRIYNSNSKITCITLFDFNDKISSLITNPAYTCVFYKDAGCNGDVRIYGKDNPSSRSSDLRTTGFDNVISSIFCG